MKKEKLKQIIAECCNDVYFDYNGKHSGIVSVVNNYVPTFTLWYGEEEVEYHDIEEVMNDKFYGGQSLNDLAEKIEIFFS